MNLEDGFSTLLLTGAARYRRYRVQLDYTLHCDFVPVKDVVKDSASILII